MLPFIPNFEGNMPASEFSPKWSSPPKVYGCLDVSYSRDYFMTCGLCRIIV